MVLLLLIVQQVSLAVIQPSVRYLRPTVGAVVGSTQQVVAVVAAVADLLPQAQAEQTQSQEALVERQPE